MLNTVLKSNTTKPKKKYKGVLLLKSPIRHVIKGINMNQSSQSASTNKDYSGSFVTPLSTTVTRTVNKSQRNEKKSVIKKFLLTATSHNAKRHTLIKHTNIQLKKTRHASNTPIQRYSTSKDQALYLNNCNKCTSYLDKSLKCVSRNKTKIQLNDNNNDIDIPKQETFNAQKRFYTQHFVSKSFKPVYDHLENLIRSNKNEVKHYINIETTQTEIPLCHKESFDNQVRYPMVYCNYQTNQSKTFILSKHYSLNNMTNKFSLRKEVQDRVKDIKRSETLKHNKEKLKKWKKLIIHAAIESKQCNVTIDDLVKIPKKSSIPYEHNQAYELFQALKDGNKEHFTHLIEENYCLVFDFDHAFQTVLHWLAKRNRYDWISFSIRHGAGLNSRDCTGKTPLHIASLMNNVESVQVLLYEMANPFSKDNNDLTPDQLTCHPRIIFIFNRVILLYAIHSMGKSKKFEENVKRGLRFLYINELNTDFSINRFCIIEKHYTK